MSAAGLLNCRVSIQQKTPGADELGQPLTTWVELASAWADIRQAGGMESIKAGAQMSVSKASIRVRKRADVTSAMRVVHGSTTYEVLDVLQDEKSRQYTDLVCEVIE